MTDALRSEILVPAHPSMRGMLLVAATSTAICAAAAFTATTRTTATQVTFVPAPVIVEADTSAAVAVTEPEQPASNDELQLVFAANGAMYMKLADVDRDAMPQHGKPKLHSKDYVEHAIATVAREDMPIELRRWEGRKVRVDNTCETSVTGFAIVSRLTGDTGYAGIDGKWTARNVLESGSAVLAAKLAGCTGTFARDALLPPVIIPTELDNNELAARARAAVLASTPAREAQLEYAAYDTKKKWWESETAEISTKIVRHPTTGVTWVSVHVMINEGCGGPQGNVWGLFRVEGVGTLVPAQLRTLDDLWAIDRLIDIDNDGELELIGKPWLGLDTVVTSGSGAELDRLSLQFFGCPC
jgi:hypothetical protein